MSDIRLFLAIVLSGLESAFVFHLPINCLSRDAHQMRKDGIWFPRCHSLYCKVQGKFLSHQHRRPLEAGRETPATIGENDGETKHKGFTGAALTRVEQAQLVIVDVGRRTGHVQDLLVFKMIVSFLRCEKQPYKRLCPSVHPLVRRSVGPWVRHAFLKNSESK